jgi:hypothetical protein
MARRAADSQSRTAVRRPSDRRRSAITRCSPRSTSFRPLALKATRQIEGFPSWDRLPQTGSWMQDQKNQSPIHRTDAHEARREVAGGHETKDRIMLRIQ